MNSSDDEEYIPHEEHEEEPWLVSYADLMTLLFGFFVLMYTFASAKISNNGEDMITMRKEIAQHFGGDYITPYEGLAKTFKKDIVKNTQMSKNIIIKTNPEGIDITFRSKALYKSGSAKLYDGARKNILKLINLVKKKKKTFEVTVEGHTDSVPIRHSKNFPSNWELSSARAASVVRLFEANGFPSNKLVAIGYGDTRPEFPNYDDKGNPIKENMARNRRVTLKIYAK